MNPSNDPNGTKVQGSPFAESQLNDVSSTGALTPSSSSLEGDQYASMASEEAAMKQRFEAAAAGKTRGRMLKFAALGTVLVVGLVLVTFRQLNSTHPSNGTTTDASLRYHNISIPLAALATDSPALSVEKTQTLSINGQLNVNNSLVLAPTTRPDGALTGQLYYDQATNRLAYYNGSSFQNVLTGDNLVTTTLGGASGTIATGSGLSVAANTLSNTGVLTLQGQSGNITLAAGPGIVVSGTTLSNSGLLSLGGQNGAITLGAGLGLTGSQLRNTGIISATGAGSITVTNDGNGNITIDGPNGSGGSGTVASPGGTAGKIAKFTGVQTIADSLIGDDGTTVTVGGDLSVTGNVSLTNALPITSGGTGGNTALSARTNLGAAKSGANSDITSLSGLTTALTVAQGGTGVGTLATNGVILGNGTSPLTSVVAGSAGQCLVSTAGAPIWSACPGAGGVSSLNGGTGALTLNNASLAGSNITINDATTAAKGIASFNSTNFTVASGAVNTIQNINTTAAPTFGQLTLTSSQATNPMFVVNNTNAAASGALLDLQQNGVSKFSVTPAGNITAAGTLNGQTISSSANLTGTLTVAGAINGQTISSAANFTGSVAIGTTLTVNTVTPTSSLTVGSTGQSFLLQGNASSTFTATNGANTTTLGFQTPTANVTYNFPTAAAGTYNICTTVGNCAGVGGGVTTPGGTANTIAKFTASGTIGNSSITDNGTTVTVGGTLSVNTITPTSTLTIGATGQSLTLQGATVNLTSTAGGVTNSLTFATPSGVNKTITIPNATGTLAVSASGPLALDAAGNLTCPTCLTSGGGGGTAGVTSVDGLTGALTLNNSTGSGTAVTINNAKADGSTKGIGTFNSTNFSDNGSGVINTVQDISVTATPTFGQLTVTSSQAANAMMVVNNTNPAATGNLIDLQLNGSSKLSVAPNGNTIIAGTLTSGLINGQTISSAANFTGSVTVGTTLAVNTITPSGSLTVGSTGQSFVLQGNGASTITSTANGHIAALGFTGGSPTTDPTYKLDSSAATGTYTICTTAGNCVGSGGSVAGSGTNNRIAKFTSTGSTIGDSSISDNGSSVTLNTNVNLILQGSTAYISNPQGQTDSEAFGAGAVVTNSSSLAVGKNASVSAPASVALGTSSSAAGFGHSVAVGYSSYAQDWSIAIGDGARIDNDTNTGNGSTAQFGVAIGTGARANSSSIALGFGATAASGNQFVVGGDNGGIGAIQQMVVGNGVTDAAPVGFTLQATSGSGTNITGASMTLAGGQGTGTGAGGNIYFQVAVPGGSGSSLNSLVTVATISGTNGSVTFKNAANSTAAFQIQNASSANIVQVDTANARVGINTAGAPTSTLEITGTLRLDGTTTENFHTPGTNGDGSNGININARLNIPFSDPGSFGQIIALGLPSNANTNARGITILDARTTFHQPSINVVSPNENGTFGLTWNGSNTLPLIYTSAGQLGFGVGGATPTYIDSSNAGLVQLVVGIAGPGGKDGALTLGNASNSNQVSILTGTTSSSYTVKLPATIGSAGNCLNIAGVVGSVETLGYTSCGLGGGSVFLQGGNAFGAAGVLGTTDNNVLTIITNNATRATFAADGSSLTLGSNTSLILQGSSAHISNTQGQTNSEAFGAGASVSGNTAVAVGGTASAGTGGTAIGYGAATSGFGGSVAIGKSSSASDWGVAIGEGAINNGNWGVAIGESAFTEQNAVAVGNAAAANSGSVVIGSDASSGGNNRIVLGNGATATADDQFVAGSNSSAIDHVIFGNGVTNAAPLGFTLQATSTATGTTDVAGGSVTIAGGQGTGTGTGGSINFQIAKPGTTGSSQNALTTVATINGANGSTLFKNAADSTTAFQVQNAAGSNTILSVDSANSRVTTSGGLYITDPTNPRQFSFRVDPTTGLLKLTANSVGMTVGGDTTDTGNGNMVSASKYNSNTGGTINSVYFFSNNANGTTDKVEVAIYADNGSGSPSGQARLGTSNLSGTVLNAGPAWTKLSLTSTVTLAPNTTYWFAFNVNSSSLLFGAHNGLSGDSYYAGTSGSYTFGASGLPTPFPSTGLSNSNRNYALYAPYNTVTDQTQSAAAFTVDDNNSVVFRPRYNQDDGTGQAATFQVQNASGTALLSVDTYSGYVGADNLQVGSVDTTYNMYASGHATSGTAAIYRSSSITTENILSLLSDVGGAKSVQLQVKDNGNLTFGNTADHTISTTQASSGTGKSLTVVAGQGASGQVGGNLILQGGLNGTVSGTPGSVIVKANGGDSATAFQIQNFVGTALFTADTANKQIIVGASAGSGSVFVNNGATVNSTLALGDFSGGGSIGSAATTVDIYTSISIAQTTAGKTLTLPNPSAGTTYGRMLYLSNIGTTSFTVGGFPLKNGATASFVWSNTNGGASWQYAGVDGASILNQNTSDQTADFRISGTGRANTSFISPLVDAISGGLGVGTSTATGVTIGGTTNTTALLLQGAASATYTIGTSNNTGGITLGNSTASNTINIGNATVATGNTEAVNIGTASTGTGKVNVTIGSTNAASTTTIQGGTGNITLQTNSASAKIIAKTGTNAANGFQIQDSSNAVILNTDTTNGKTTLTATAANEALVVKRGTGSTVTTPIISFLDTGGGNLGGIIVNSNGDLFFGGGNTGYTGTTGENTGVGAAAFSSITTGNYNTAVGTASLTNLTTGTNNVAVGVSSLNQLTAGQNNTALGTKAFNGVLMTSGNDGNTAVGASAGFLAQPAVSNFYNNTFVGGGSGGQDNDNFYTLNNIHNSTAIGQNSQVQASNTIVIGNSDSVPAQIVIGNTMPTGTNMFGVSALIYKAGTASQSTNTITGFGTTWNAANGVKVGMRFVFANGTDAGTITAINSTTSLTVSTSQTVSPAKNYRIINPGFQVTNTGDTYVSSTSSTAFRVQDAAGSSILTADTSARGASGGNLIKIGDSTGTDGSLTLLQLDSTTADPTSNLSALNGSLFYNSTTNKVSLIENGQVKIICNTTDLGCGTGTVKLQDAYFNSTGGTTPEVLLDATRKGLDIQDANSTIGASQALFAVRGSATATTLGTAYFQVLGDGRVGVNGTVASYQLNVTGNGSSMGALNLQGGTGSSGGSGGNGGEALTATGGNGGSASSAGSSAGSGGGITLTGGNGGVGSLYYGGYGGGITLQGGNGGDSNSGNPNYAGSGGTINIQAGNGGGGALTSGGTGGNVNIYAGNGGPFMNGGSVTIHGGNPGSFGTSYGNVYLWGQSVIAWGDSTSVFQVQNSSTTPIFTVDSVNKAVQVTGTALVKTTTNSATGFQIQNATAAALLTADTSAMTITIGSGGNTITLNPVGGLVAAGTARHTKTILLTPEYAGGVLDALGDASCSSAFSGTMTSGYDSTNRMNYYDWTSAQGSAQCYDVIAQVPIPSDFSAWSGNPDIEMTKDSTGTAAYAIQIVPSSGSDANYGSFAVHNALTTSWSNMANNPLSGTYTAGDYLTIKIRMTSTSGANVKLGNIKLQYLSAF